MNPLDFAYGLQTLEVLSIASEAIALRYNRNTVLMLMESGGNHKAVWWEHIGILKDIEYKGDYILAYVPYMPEDYYHAGSANPPAQYIVELIDLYRNYQLIGYEDWPSLPQTVEYENLLGHGRKLMREYNEKLLRLGINTDMLRLDAAMSNVRLNGRTWVLYDPFYNRAGGYIKKNPLAKLFM